MKKDFIVKCKNFNLLEAFKKECEAMGWEYYHEFNPFEKRELVGSSGLFFCTEWEGKPRFAFSNSMDNVFKLPMDWDAALLHAENIYKEVTEKKVLTREQIARKFGVSPNQLEII